jgi:hypothetical protein
MKTPFDQLLTQAIAQQQGTQPVQPTYPALEPALPTAQPGFLSLKPTATNGYCTVRQYMHYI